jgi:hypothetical protein
MLKLHRNTKQISEHWHAYLKLLCHVMERGVHGVLVGRPEGKRPLGRPRRRWEDNIKMDLQEVGGGCGDSMELAQDRDKWRALVSRVVWVIPVVCN